MTRQLAFISANSGLEPRRRDRHCLTYHCAADGRILEMTQTTNRFFDEIGRLMNDAAGAAQGVKREEFEAVKEMARLAREENEALKARIAALEAKLGISPTAPDTGSLKTG